MSTQNSTRKVNVDTHSVYASISNAKATHGTGAREVGPSDHLDRVDACCDVADRVEVGVPAWSSEKERCRSIGCCSFGAGDTEALEVLGSRQQCKVSEEVSIEVTSTLHVTRQLKQNSS